MRAIRRLRRAGSILPFLLLAFIVFAGASGHHSNEGSETSDNSTSRSDHEGASSDLASREGRQGENANNLDGAEGSGDGFASKRVHFVVSSNAGDSVTAMDSFDLILLAVDDSNAIVETFRGTADLTSSDAGAHLPHHAVFKPADRGVTLVRNVKLETFGEQTITAVSERTGGTGKFDVKHNPMRGPIPKRLGDLNGDGQITQADVNLLIAFLQGSVQLNPVQKLAADMNRDGSIDETDLALLAAAVGSAPSGEGPHIAFEEPAHGIVDRQHIDIRVEYGDGQGGVVSDSLLIFSERILSRGLPVGPGTDIVTTLSFATKVGLNEARVRLPDRAFPLGKNELRAAILDSAGNIGVATVSFTATGVQLVHQEGETIGQSQLLIAAELEAGVHEDEGENRGGEEEAPKHRTTSSWDLVDGTGLLFNASEFPRARVLTSNLIMTRPAMVDVPVVVPRVSLTEGQLLVAQDDKPTKGDRDKTVPHIPGVRGGLLEPGKTGLSALPVVAPEGGKVTGLTFGKPTTATSPQGAGPGKTVGGGAPGGNNTTILVPIGVGEAPNGLYVITIEVTIDWEKDGKKQNPVKVTVAIPVFVQTGGMAALQKLLDANLAKIEKWIKDNETSDNDVLVAEVDELKAVLEKAKKVGTKPIQRNEPRPLFSPGQKTVEFPAAKPEDIVISGGITDFILDADGFYVVSIEISAIGFRDEKAKLEAMLHELRHAANYSDVNDRARKEGKKAKDIDRDGDGIPDDADPHPDVFDDSEAGAHDFGKKFIKLIDP